MTVKDLTVFVNIGDNIDTLIFHNVEKIDFEGRPGSTMLTFQHGTEVYRIPFVLYWVEGN